jgi:hypothetical protein
MERQKLDRSDNDVPLYAAIERLQPQDRESNGGRGAELLAYNFIKIHSSIRMKPAMAAGVTSKLWDVGRFGRYADRIGVEKSRIDMVRAGQISVAKAIAVGLLFVNTPVPFLMVAPIAAMVYADKYGLTHWEGNWQIVPAFLLGFVMAWLWWSITVPKWRLWAYTRVNDIAKLKKAAVGVGLTWPDGSQFARTEIKSKNHARRERRLDPTLELTESNDDDR